MSLVPKFITSEGRKEVREAHETLQKLEQKEGKKGNIKGRDRATFEKARQITRRDFLEKVFTGIVAVGGIAGGVGVYFRRPEQEQQDGNPGNVVERNEEESVQALIERIENDFPQFKTRLQENIRQMGGLPRYVQEEEFYAPFDLVQLNENNPRRNRRTLNREIAAKPEGRVEIRQDDINFFSYDTVSAARMPNAMGNRFVAAYVPVERTMQLDTRLDVQNPLEAAVLYHELRHIAQDTNRRAQLQTREQFEAYVAFHRVEPGQMPKLILAEELTAYAYELEVLNILLQDRLRSGLVTSEEAARILGLRRDQQSTFDMLHEFARLYYPDGMTDGTFAQPFIERCAQVYADAGYEVYAPTADGQLRRIR